MFYKVDTIIDFYACIFQSRSDEAQNRKLNVIEEFEEAIQGKRDIKLGSKEYDFAFFISSFCWLINPFNYR